MPRAKVKEDHIMTFNDIFKSSFLQNVTSISILDMIIAMLLAFAIGIFIYLDRKSVV